MSVAFNMTVALWSLAMDKFVHDQNLDLYRLQLNRTTNEETRRQLLRLIAQENEAFRPRRGQTASIFLFSGRDGAGGFRPRSRP
jgi:hypothetical protein